MITLAISTLKKYLLFTFLTLSCLHIFVVLFFFNRTHVISFGKNLFLDLFFFEFEKTYHLFFQHFYFYWQVFYVC